MFDIILPAMCCTLSKQLLDVAQSFPCNITNTPKQEKPKNFFFAAAATITSLQILPKALVAHTPISVVLSRREPFGRPGLNYNLSHFSSQQKLVLLKGLFKIQNMSSPQLNSKNNGLSLLFKTI